MLRTIREFWNDQRGIAMILVAIMLPVLVGFAILAIDMSRANSLHNDLQKGADAMALAAAGELDGRADSISRAKRALANLVTGKDPSLGSGNKYSFSGTSTVAQTLTDAGVTVRFLRSIPPSDDEAIRTEDVITDEITDAKDAIFAEVRVTPVGFDAIFPVSYLNGSTNDSFNVGATAVAGFEQSICETVPVFMCNPFETDTPATSKTIQQAFASGDTYSREFRILKVDNNPGPGNFGLLDNNLQSLRDAIAMGTAGTCYNRNALTTKTGVTLGQVSAGLNVRFDLYSGSLNKYNKDWNYRPATNVRKGQKSNTCSKYDPVTDNSALPLPSGSWDAGNNAYSQKIANASTFYAQYWSVNHKGAAVPSIPSTSYPTGDTTQPASRYDVYKYEIAHSLVGDKSLVPTKESGDPSCFKGDTPSLDPDRRLMNLAIVDCLANEDKINGHTQLKPDGYASVFLNTPVQKSNPSDDPDGTGAEKPISLEIVDVDGPLGNGTLDKAFRNEAQLYR
ncbi:hypothetical protein ABID26_002552 [Mesorhizobium shonense]|uniref:Putative Flp pilus-assembly TadG-like N-terminal domain-containing protein n=1 Tax=Mesorhizobium shonense TaxID=1209948 RepID=A0ABV2HRC2_9HYPH|nr:pilus assembly protein TadG-related protein [Mesorhizobium sp.]